MLKFELTTDQYNAIIKVLSTTPTDVGFWPTYWLMEQATPQLSKEPVGEDAHN